MQQMADPIIRSDTSAGKHLSKAWNCAFGRIPDYSQAYSEAIKAVEAATTPVLSPKDADATLSKMHKICGSNLDGILKLNRQGVMYQVVPFDY